MAIRVTPVFGLLPIRLSFHPRKNSKGAFQRFQLCGSGVIKPAPGFTAAMSRLGVSSLSLLIHAATAVL